MCYHVKLEKKVENLEQRRNTKVISPELYKPTDSTNGFSYPMMPVIKDSGKGMINLLNWGLVPHWSKDDSIKKFTLNSRIETIKEKPSFRDAVNNRCLVLVNGFYEWQWLDEKGKSKQKYFIKLKGANTFAMAGIWSRWTNPVNHSKMETFSIVTTAANEVMSTIHNTKKRMPIILTPQMEEEWLGNSDIEWFKKPIIDLETMKL
jgi:putative SOS response-associated peptidase YedK